MKKTSRLPIEVPLQPGAVYYRHNSTVDVVRLAEQLREIPEYAVSTVTAMIMDKGLMIPNQWWVRLAQWVAIKRGHTRYDFWKEAYNRFPGMDSDMLQQVAHHIVMGRDTEQPDSAGGFSQREINFLSNVIAIVTGAYSAEMESVAARNEVN